MDLDKTLSTIVSGTIALKMTDMLFNQKKSKKKKNKKVKWDWI